MSPSTRVRLAAAALAALGLRARGLRRVAAATVGNYVARFTAPSVADWLKTFAKSPEFLPYDWALNQP